MDHLTPITGRVQWPANQRAALVVLIHIDAPDFDAGPGSTADGLDYTATGLHRLLTAFADLDIPTTTAWTNRALTTYPQLARNAQDHGHELAMSQVDGTGPIDERPDPNIRYPCSRRRSFPPNFQGDSHFLVTIGRSSHVRIELEHHRRRRRPANQNGW